MVVKNLYHYHKTPICNNIISFNKCLYLFKILFLLLLSTTLFIKEYNLFLLPLFILHPTIAAFLGTPLSNSANLLYYWCPFIISCIISYVLILNYPLYLFQIIIILTIIYTVIENNKKIRLNHMIKSRKC